MTELFGPSPFSVKPFHLVSAFLIDLAIGDPRWLPHPVVIIGGGITRLERFLRRFCTTPFREKWAGLFMTLAIVLAVLSITSLVTIAAMLPESTLLQAAGALFLAYLLSTPIATRELIRAAPTSAAIWKIGRISSADLTLSVRGTPPRGRWCPVRADIYSAGWTLRPSRTPRIAA